MTVHILNNHEPIRSGDLSYTVRERQHPRGCPTMCTAVCHTPRQSHQPPCFNYFRRATK